MCFIFSVTLVELHEKTLHEALLGKKNSLKHLLLFYCDAYVHVLKENISNLDNKDEKCIPIGYKDGIKGYRLWNLVTKKIVYNSYVTFREVKISLKKEL